MSNYRLLRKHFWGKSNSLYSSIVCSFDTKFELNLNSTSSYFILKLNIYEVQLRTGKAKYANDSVY